MGVKDVFKVMEGVCFIIGVGTNFGTSLYFLDSRSEAIYQRPTKTIIAKLVNANCRWMVLRSHFLFDDYNSITTCITPFSY